MGKTFIVRVNVPTIRTWEPIKRAAIFGDKRTKKQRTRNAEVRKAIKESIE